MENNTIANIIEFAKPINIPTIACPMCGKDSYILMNLEEGEKTFQGHPCGCFIPDFESTLQDRKEGKDDRKDR